MRSTPKMSDSPAATSHRYMASLSPTRPWKSSRRVMRVVSALRLDGGKWRLAVVLVGRRDAQIAEVVAARRPDAVGIVGAEALQDVHRGTHRDHERLGLLEDLEELGLLHHGDGLTAPLGGEDALRLRSHHLADVAREIHGPEL